VDRHLFFFVPAGTCRPSSASPPGAGWRLPRRRSNCTGGNSSCPLIRTAVNLSLSRETPARVIVSVAAIMSGYNSEDRQRNSRIARGNPTSCTFNSGVAFPVPRIPVTLIYLMRPRQGPVPQHRRHTGQVDGSRRPGSAPSGGMIPNPVSRGTSSGTSPCARACTSSGCAAWTRACRPGTR
jgi:hypothetical protein